MSKRLQPMLRLIYLLFFIIISGCAHSVNQSDPTETKSSSQDIERQEFVSNIESDSSNKTVQENNLVELKEKDNQTKILLHIPAEVQVSPVLQDKKLILFFEPGVNLVSSEIATSDIVGSIKLKPEEPNKLVSSIVVDLKTPVQFMLSRPESDLLQVLLIPRSTSSSMEESSNKKHVLNNITFSRDQQGQVYIRISADKKPDYTILDGREDQINILFPGLNIPYSHSKIYNLSKFDTQLSSVLLKNSSDGGKLSILLENRIPMQVYTENDNLVIKLLTSRSKKKINKNPVNKFNSAKKTYQKKQDIVKKDNNDNFQEMHTLFPGMKDSYSGQKISIDLQDADVEHVLRLIAEVSGNNLILGDGVSGKISLKLLDIPWDQALDLVLLQKNLGMVAQGNIMRIVPASKIEQEQAQRRKARQAALQAKKDLEKLEPLKTEYIQVNYATAAELDPKVREFISARGKVTQDARTNMLIVSDTASQLSKIRSVIEKLDRPEKQVLIEARVVYATEAFERSLGLQWGGSVPSDGGYWNILGSQYSRSFDVTGLNLFANSAGFSIAGNISKLTGNLFSLDLQLEIGEQDNVSKTISSPKIITLNNQRAEIKQGTKMKVTTAEGEGKAADTKFVDATLTLSVQPQITPDNKLILDLDIKDDSPSGEDIDTKSTTTKLIVNDGETIVIGGVQQVGRIKNENKVPMLGDIPILGWLFKTKYWSKSKAELLIFIRPKIL